jgi:hypothetical protein
MNKLCTLQLIMNFIYLSLEKTNLYEKHIHSLALSPKGEQKHLKRFSNTAMRCLKDGE